ncbi:MAG TPA: metallophosphoesterase [Afifellaceae bacterium]|nr:metallophosphoesterase [Afifellaceae bacterium]
MEASAPRPATRPYLPPGLRIYAVGDLHGRFDLLQWALGAIADDLARDPAERSVEIYLGDYVDRGHASREVVQLLAGGEAPVCDERICLKGNHEDVLLQFLEDPSILPYWRELGGFETLYSFAVLPPVILDEDRMRQAHAEFRSRLTQSELRFLEGLKLSIEFGSYLFVHAGVDPNRPLQNQRPHDLIWIREPFLLSQADFGRIVVHGHTPAYVPERLANRINIDTGAYATGRLTCLVLEGGSQRFLQSR